MSVSGYRTGDEGKICGLGHHDSNRISATSGAGKSDQWVPLSG